MSYLSALWLLSTVKLRVPSPGVSKGLLVKFRPANTFCVASFLNKAAEAHLTPLTITFPPLKPASPQTSPAFHLLPRPSRLSFASSMQISGCGQVSVSCVQAVSPIAQGDVQTVSTIANRFYYYCTNCTMRTKFLLWNSRPCKPSLLLQWLCKLFLRLHQPYKLLLLLHQPCANRFYYCIKRPNHALWETHVGVACKDRQGGKLRIIIIMKTLLE